MSTGTLATIAKCGRGHSVRGSWDDAGRNGGWLICGCGARGIAKGLTIKITEKSCSGTCTSAFGGSCDCSCGGKNHGEDHRF